MAVNSGDNQDYEGRARDEHDLRTRQHRRLGLILLVIAVVGLAIRYAWRA